MLFRLKGKVNVLHAPRDIAKIVAAQMRIKKEYEQNQEKVTYIGEVLLKRRNLRFLGLIFSDGEKMPGSISYDPHMVTEASRNTVPRKIRLFVSTEVRCKSCFMQRNLMPHRYNLIPI